MASISEYGGFALYLNQHVQSHNVFDYMLDRAGGADKMVISSFAITEAYIRRIIRNRDRIGCIELVLDFTIGTRNPRILMFADKNTDAIYLVNNHSKLIYIEKGADKIVAIMSNNATNNHRYESGVIILDKNIAGIFGAQIELMKHNSVEYGRERTMQAG